MIAALVVPLYDPVRLAEDLAVRVDVDGGRELVRQHGLLSPHPLCGGIPPEIAWPSLAPVVEEVLPAA